ncbi:MAG: hypothetical protein AAF311_14655 [Pseudomonadota bacterium]
MINALGGILMARLSLFSMVILIGLSSTAMAQMPSEDRDELFERMDQMCRDADTEVTRFIEFEGEAGARGVLKLVGAEISGSVTVQQYENLEQKLNDFRTNPTICQFEAFKLLQSIFGTTENDEGGNDETGSINFEGFLLGSETVADFQEKYPFTSQNLRRVSMTDAEVLLDGEFERLTGEHDYRDLPGKMRYRWYFKDSQLVSVEAYFRCGNASCLGNCSSYESAFH